MAYNFLGLVNDLNQRAGEVELTSSNFASADGYYNLAKQAVNASIRYINQDTFTWPFNHTTQEDTLVAGTTRYAFPSDSKYVDKNTFRIKRDGTIGNESKYLKLIDYEDYLSRFVDDEYNTTNEGIRSIPTYVFITTDREYGVYPVPDEAYPLVYEYYSVPTDLSAYDDVPSIPEQFRYLIGDGAHYYLNFFSGSYEEADRIWNKYNEGIKDMRSIYVNHYDYLRDTRLERKYDYITAVRVN